MQYERRKSQRINVDLPARWEGATQQNEARVTSLSYNGCFLLSGGKVEPKELLRLEIYVNGEQTIYAWGEVVDAAYEIGFALRFTLLEPEDQSRLAQLILEFQNA